MFYLTLNLYREIPLYVVDKVISHKPMPESILTFILNIMSHTDTVSTFARTQTSSRAMYMLCSAHPFKTSSTALTFQIAHSSGQVW